MIQYDPAAEEFRLKEEQRRADLFSAIMHYFMTERARRSSPEDGMGNKIRVEIKAQPPHVFRKRKASSMDYAGPTPVAKNKVKKKKKKISAKEAAPKKMKKKPAVKKVIVKKRKLAPKKVKKKIAKKKTPPLESKPTITKKRSVLKKARRK